MLDLLGNKWATASLSSLLKSRAPRRCISASEPMLACSVVAEKLVIGFEVRGEVVNGILESLLQFQGGADFLPNPAFFFSQQISMRLPVSIVISRNTLAIEDKYDGKFNPFPKKGFFSHQENKALGQRNLPFSQRHRCDQSYFPPLRLSMNISVSDLAPRRRSGFGAAGGRPLTSQQSSQVVSRTLHNGVPFDIDLPLTGSVGIECRSGGASNDYQIVFMFPSAVTFNSASVTPGTGAVSSSSGSGTTTVTVNLTGVINAQTITVTLSSVSDGTGTGDVGVQMGVLVGDTTGDGTVNSGDIAQTKSKSGQAVDSSNFRSDVTVDGSLNSGDIGFVKSKSGTALP